jgi:hypothetical protein
MNKLKLQTGIFIKQWSLRRQLYKSAKMIKNMFFKSLNRFVTKQRMFTGKLKSNRARSCFCIALASSVVARKLEVEKRTRSNDAFLVVFAAHAKTLFRGCSGQGQRLAVCDQR